MVVSHPTRRERKKDAVRAKIVACAIDLFESHGIDGVTVDQISEAADVGKGTIYNYFKTKEEIIVAFIVDFERTVQAKLDAFASSKRRLDTILSDFILLQFRLKENHHRFTRILLAQMFLRTEQFLPYIVEIQRAADPPLQSLFRLLQARQLIRDDLKAEDFVRVLRTVLMGLTAVWAIEGPPFAGTQGLVEQQTKLFAEGIRRTS